MSASFAKPAFAARTVLLDGTVAGLRIIDSLGSILSIYAAPFSELDRMRRDCGFSRYMTYVIDTPRIYTGHGRDTRKIGDRVAQEAKERSQVYVMCSTDPRFDKPMNYGLEARLIDTGWTLGVPLANSMRPFGHNGFAPSAETQQLFEQALVLLSVAGFRRFEEARNSQARRPYSLVATNRLNDVQLLEPEEMEIPPDAVRMHLACRDLKAEGYSVGNRFHVLPGAHYSYAFKSGLSEDNRARRRAIEALDICQPLPGVEGRGQLRVGLNCQSSAIAAKVLSGEHIGTNAWKPRHRGSMR